jgi:hypothetical protein
MHRMLGLTLNPKPQTLNLRVSSMHRMCLLRLSGHMHLAALLASLHMAANRRERDLSWWCDCYDRAPLRCPTLTNRPVCGYAARHLYDMHDVALEDRILHDADAHPTPHLELDSCMTLMGNPNRPTHHAPLLTPTDAAAHYIALETACILHDVDGCITHLTHPQLALPPVDTN